MNLKDKFTYGFEIEGQFTWNLIDKLIEKRDQGEIELEEYEDGSVHRLTTDSDFSDEYHHQELTLGVFETFEEFIKALKWFQNGDNYLQDYHCGLHIHIKPKEDEEYYRNLIADRDFICHLQDWSIINLCEQIERRLTDTLTYHYSIPYIRNLSVIRNEWKKREKYRFIRNHPSKTLEFRFFSTCEHKVENVETFFDYFFKFLKAVNPKKSIIEEINVQEDKTELNTKEKLSVEKEVIEQVYQIDNSKERVLEAEMKETVRKLLNLDGIIIEIPKYNEKMLSLVLRVIKKHFDFSHWARNGVGKKKQKEITEFHLDRFHSGGNFLDARQSMLSVEFRDSYDVDFSQQRYLFNHRIKAEDFLAKYSPPLHDKWLRLQQEEQEENCFRTSTYREGSIDPFEIIWENNTN